MEEGKVWMWMIPSVRAGRDGRDMGENCEVSGKRTTLGKLRGKKTPDETSESLLLAGALPLSGKRTRTGGDPRLGRAVGRVLKAFWAHFLLSGSRPSLCSGPH